MTNKKIAFVPHKTRGQEIIKILEEMGGVNMYNIDGSEGIIAIETKLRGNPITNDWDYCGLLELGYEVYTLETWEEKNNSVHDEMVSIDKVKDWIFDTFYEDAHDGDYDYGEPYIVCTLDTMEQLLENFEKTMEK